MADFSQMQADLDVTSLVREEIITDRKVGSIRMLIPVTVDGLRDETRQVIFLGETQIMTQMGPLPINFPIVAETLADAIAGYGEAAKQGVKDTIEKLQEMRREAATKIVTPGDAGFAQAASKIQMP